MHQLHSSLYHQIIKRWVNVPGRKRNHPPHRLGNEAHRKKLIIPDIAAEAQKQTAAGHSQGAHRQQDTCCLPPCLFFITHLSVSVIPGTNREKTAADAPCGFSPAVKSLPLPKGMAYFAGFPSSVTVILRISFVLISLQISLMKVSRGFTPSSPAKRLLTETVPSSSSFCPTTSI